MSNLLVAGVLLGILVVPSWSISKYTLMAKNRRSIDFSKLPPYTGSYPMENVHLNESQYPSVSGVESFEHLRELLRGPNVHTAHGYRPYGDHTWTPWKGLDIRDSFDPREMRTEELEEFLIQYANETKSWKYCSSKGIIVGMCGEGGFGNWVRGDLGGMMLALELGVPFTRQCDVDALIPLEKLFQPKGIGFDWVQFRGQLSQGDTCVFGKREIVESPLEAALYEPSDVFAILLTLSQVRRVQAPPTIYWRQFRHLPATDSSRLPPISPLRARRLLRVPEFRAIIGCTDPKDCRHTLANLHRVASGVAWNAFMKPSRDFAAFVAARIRAMNIIPGKQYIVGLHIRAGIDEGASFSGGVNVTQVLMASWDQAQSVCRRLECGYGRRPLGCTYIVATDTSMIYEALLEIVPSSATLIRACEGHFFHISTLVRIRDYPGIFETMFIVGIQKHAVVMQAARDMQSWSEIYKAILSTMTEWFLLSAVDGIVASPSTFSQLAIATAAVPSFFESVSSARFSAEFIAKGQFDQNMNSSCPDLAEI